MSWKDKKYNVLFKTGNRKGQVAKMPWLEAKKLDLEGKASFISNTLYKAAKAGINIIDIEKPDEKKLKAQIAEIRERALKSKEKQEKSKEKGERKRRGKKGEAKEEKVTATA